MAYASCQARAQGVLFDKAWEDYGVPSTPEPWPEDHPHLSLPSQDSLQDGEFEVSHLHVHGFVPVHGSAVTSPTHHETACRPPSFVPPTFGLNLVFNATPDVAAHDVQSQADWLLPASFSEAERCNVLMNLLKGPDADLPRARRCAGGSFHETSPAASTASGGSPTFAEESDSSSSAAHMSRLVSGAPTDFYVQLLLDHSPDAYGHWYLASVAAVQGNSETCTTLCDALKKISDATLGDLMACADSMTILIMVINVMGRMTKFFTVRLFATVQGFTVDSPRAPLLGAKLLLGSLHTGADLVSIMQEVLEAWSPHLLEVWWQHGDTHELASLAANAVMHIYYLKSAPWAFHQNRALVDTSRWILVTNCFAKERENSFLRSRLHAASMLSCDSLQHFLRAEAQRCIVELCNTEGINEAQRFINELHVEGGIDWSGQLTHIVAAMQPPV